MNEETLIKTLDLPFNQRWLWMGDANMVILSPELDEAGRQAALSEVQDHWRRSCLRVVPDVADLVPRSMSPIRAVVEAL